MSKHLLDASNPVAIIHEPMPSCTEHGVESYCCLLLLCTSGHAKLHISCIERDFRPGCIAFVKPGESFQTKRASKDYGVLGLLYTKEIMHEATMGLDKLHSGYLPTALVFNNEQLNTIFEHVVATIETLQRMVSMPCITDVTTMGVRAFFRTYREVMSHMGLTPNATQRRKLELYQLFYDSLTQNYRKERTASFYAKQLNITTKYLNDIVRQVSCMSTKDAIDEYMLIKLKMELQSSSFSLKEIAFNFGFSSVAFLCSYFKRKTGTTPQQYRNQ